MFSLSPAGPLRNYYTPENISGNISKRKTPIFMFRFEACLSASKRRSDFLMFSSLLSSRDLFTQKLLEDTHVSIFQKTLNIFKYLNNSFYISYSEQLKGTGRQSCVSLCPRTKIEEERAHVSAPSIPKLYSRAYMCIPLYKVKNRIPQAHVFSLNVQKRMSARIYVCLSLRSKTN
jgi:hypothetical protein